MQLTSTLALSLFKLDCKQLTSKFSYSEKIFFLLRAILTKYEHRQFKLYVMKYLPSWSCTCCVDEAS